MYLYPQTRLLLFAKAPQVGRVKTRLIPELGAKQATEWHIRLLELTLQQIARARVAPLQIWTPDSLMHPFWRNLGRGNRLINPAGDMVGSASLWRQWGENLGERMGHALASSLRRYPFVLLMGSDCPSITAADIRRAVDELANGQEAVLIPTEDGGYGLIGLSRYHWRLFADIDWSTERVFAQTAERLRQLNYRWSQLPTRWDVDRPEDLHRLASTGSLSLRADDSLSPSALAELAEAEANPSQLC